MCFNRGKLIAGNDMDIKKKILPATLATKATRGNQGNQGDQVALVPWLPTVAPRQATFPEKRLDGIIAQPKTVGFPMQQCAPRKKSKRKRVCSSSFLITSVPACLASPIRCLRFSVHPSCNLGDQGNLGQPRQPGRPGCSGCLVAHGRPEASDFS